MWLIEELPFVVVNLFFGIVFGIGAPIAGLIIYTVLTGLMIAGNTISIYWIVTIILPWTYYLLKNKFDTELYQYGCKDCDFNTNDFIEAHHHAVDKNHKTFHRVFQK